MKSETNVNTSVFANGDIVQEVTCQNSLTEAREVIMREIIQTREEQVRKALIALGWTPPGEGQR